MGKVEAYLKVKDVARYAGLSVEGVEELIEKGELEALELNGRTKVKKSEIDSWLDEQVNLDALMELKEKIDGDVDVDGVAEELDMEPEEVREKLIDDS